MKDFYAVIMAGGGGTRLWPLSRISHPKQMLNLIDDNSLFQIAFNRMMGLLSPEQIFVVTGQDHAETLQRQVPAIPKENFILEPEPRGTASAIGLTAAVLQKRNPNATMAVLTADHFMKDNELFQKILTAAYQVAQQGSLVTLGISPEFPATGYGYIKQGEEFGDYNGFPTYCVDQFVEKPPLERAEQMLAAGNYAWNSGMFIWKIKSIMQEFATQMPTLHQALLKLQSAYDTSDYAQALLDHWIPLKNETIDYGIMENAKNVVVIPGKGLGWNDVGSWDSFFSIIESNADGNIVRGPDIEMVDTKNSLLFSEKGKRLLVTIGVENIAVIDTDDVILVCNTSRAQDVKKAISILKEKDKKQYL